MDKVEVTTRLITELFSKMGVDAQVEVSEDTEAEAIKVAVEGDNLGILIGRHGETLQAIQLVLSLMLAKALGEWQPVAVDVGSWRLRREEQLKRRAAQAAEEVVNSGREEVLPPMAPFERRIVHLALTDHPQVTTESTGEGPERCVVVKPRS